MPAARAPDPDDDGLSDSARRLVAETGLIGEWRSATGMHLRLIPATSNGENVLTLVFPVIDTDADEGDLCIVMPMPPEVATYLAHLLRGVDRDHAADELDDLVTALDQAATTVVELALLG